MKYTPAQIRTLLGLPGQSFRNGRKLLPPLQDRNGYHPYFRRAILKLRNIA
jgi:hypothetical protein